STILNKGLTIVLKDERTEKHAEFHYTGGIAEFIKHLNKNKDVLHPTPIYAEAERDEVRMEFALQYNEGYAETVFSFANNINTVDGGNHLSGFRSALTRAINQFGQNQGLFKEVKENLQGEDVREGLVAVISVKLPQPQFEGQTKGKLNSDIQSTVASFVYEKLMEQFEKNPTIGRKICAKSIDAARARQDPERGEGPVRQDAGPRRNPRAHHRARHRHWEGRFRRHQTALRQDHHHDRRRRGRLPHPHPAADVLLPPDVRARRTRPRLYRAAAPLPDQERQVPPLHSRRERVSARTDAQGHGGPCGRNRQRRKEGQARRRR